MAKAFPRRHEDRWHDCLSVADVPRSHAARAARLLHHLNMPPTAFPGDPMRSAMFPVALLVITGCATATLPADRLTSLEASIRAADEVAAGQQPQPSLHVRLAEEELA